MANPFSMMRSLQNFDDRLEFPTARSIIGKTNAKYSEGASSLITKRLGTPFTTDDGFAIPGRFDNNSPMERPVTNIPSVVTYIQDDLKRETYDMHPGAPIFMYRAEDGRVYHPETGKQVHWMKSMGALNQYMHKGEGRRLYRDIYDGYEMMKIWGFVGFQWSPTADEASALGDRNQALAILICGNVETHDLWAVQRCRNAKGTQIGCITQIASHVFFIWERVHEKDDDMLLLRPHMIDQYYWRIRPYHSNKGAGIDCLLFIGNDNEDHPNCHRAGYIHVGRVTQRINRTGDNETFVTSAFKASYPEKLTNDYIADFNRLPRIQIQLKGH